MILIRNVDGERVRLDAVKPAVLKRIEMLGKLNDRREMYKVAGDWESLAKLADEYEEKHMPNMAGVIRKEAVEHGAVVVRPSTVFRAKEKKEKEKVRRVKTRSDKGKRHNVRGRVVL
jgi:hypothetical protein